MSIENVSDTALWVAMYRAMESERPDAHFRDPWARTLAGERGETILEDLRRGRQSAWAMIVRTILFDELIRSTVRDHDVEVVVNLAAGLDTRPWRMELPVSLSWVDVDLPGIIDYKAGVMKDEPPRCRYQAMRADLTDGEARRSALASAVGTARCAMVVSEGLLIYLDPGEVGALASDLHAVQPLGWWLTDLASPRLRKIMERSWGKEVQAADAPFRFGPAEGSSFFEPFGWREAVWRSTWEEAHRLRREMKGAWIWRGLGRLFPKRVREEYRRFAGTLLLERM